MTSKIKPVKAWGIRARNGRVLAWAYPRVDHALMACAFGQKPVSVEIRGVQPKRKHKGAKRG